MIRMKKPTPPSIFQRLFLSHLILLALSFLSAVVLFLHLFAPGVKMFLLHNPLLVLPVVMLLILFAAILSSWAAGILATQLEEIILDIARRQGEPVPGPRSLKNRVQEIDELQELIAHLDPVSGSRTPDSDRSSTGIVHVALDQDFRITGLDPETERIIGVAPDEARGKLFVDLFCDAAYRASVSYRMQLLQADQHRITDLVTRTSRNDGSSITMLWNSVPGPVHIPEFAQQIQLLGHRITES